MFFVCVPLYGLVGWWAGGLVGRRNVRQDLGMGNFCLLALPSCQPAPQVAGSSKAAVQRGTDITSNPSNLRPVCANIQQ